MKNLYKNILFLMALALVCVGNPAYAKQGDDCSNPILLTPDYHQTIWGEGAVWYVANTFDLPLAIVYYPANANQAAPDLELDFGCNPGHYDDPILCSLFCSSNSAYIALPYKETPPMSYDGEGKPCYKVEFGQFYRDMLLQQGIDYNIEVFVKVTFHGSGEIGMAPNAFNTCMDGQKFMHLGDTVQVKANDKERHVIVPYIQWQYDSIRYVWNGTEPCTLAVGSKCDFDPTATSDVIIDKGTLQPGGVFKVSSKLLMEYVDSKKHPNDAGMYFAKFYSAAPGVMKVEQIPAPPPAGGAELLKYGQKTVVNANDTATVYAMPSSWVKDMQFTTPTNRVFKMYIGTTPTFYTTEAVFTYQFDKTEVGHALSLFEADLATIWAKKLKSENYLYVRFECTANTTVMPSLWTPSDCILKAKRIKAGEQFEVVAQSKTIYSLYYEEWKNGDMTLAWTSGQATCPFYIADTCVVPNADEAPVFYAGTIAKRGTTTCNQEVVASWADYVDADGFLYIRFYSSAKAKITVTTNAPEEADPTCETFDSVMIVTAWDSYEWYDQTYTESGNYTHDGTLDPETGCLDTLFTLRLTVRKTSYDTVSMTNCDTIVYNWKNYTESGVYQDTLMKGNAGRLVTTLYLNVLKSTTEELTIRQFTPYISGQGKTYDESGDYEEHLPNAAGCDSTIILHVKILTSGVDTVSETACDSITYNGVTYTVSGVYFDTAYMESGDRLVTVLNLTIPHSYHNELTIAQREPYLSGAGIEYTTSGVYTEAGKTTAGCDSVVTLRITIIGENTEYDTLYFCNGFNTRHEEVIGEDHILRYEPFTYQSPAEWDYMEGVIVKGEATRSLVDLRRAEENLKAHYVDGLEPVVGVYWMHRLHGTSGYQPIEASDEPQWIEAGTVVVQVQFMCGHVYRTDFTTDVEQVEAAVEATKIIRNGQVLILRNGAAYTLMGEIVNIYDL